MSTALARAWSQLRKRLRPSDRPPWLRVVAYGALLAVGALGLQWLDYRRLARAHSGDVYILLIALGFLALGVMVGLRLHGRARAAAQAEDQPAFDGNPQAVASLGISVRELEVLHELAVGRSDKEIAARLNVSPNTVKTHVSRLFDKLGARRRTDAVHKARELGIVR